MFENFEEANYLLFKLNNMYERELAKSLEPICKHGKTMAQKKKEIAKRHSRNKNKKTHRK